MIILRIRARIFLSIWINCGGCIIAIAWTVSSRRNFYLQLSESMFRIATVPANALKSSDKTIQPIPVFNANAAIVNPNQAASGHRRKGRFPENAQCGRTTPAECAGMAPNAAIRATRHH
jgi:hypothetical protein